LGTPDLRREISQRKNLDLFGRDIKDNIFMLITFIADGQKPPVITALEEAETPYTQAFKFNNSALFAQHAAANDSDDGDSFEEMFWKMGASSYRKFMTELAKAKPRSLSLTKEVLQVRQQLEAHVMGIQQRIKNSLVKMDNLKTTINSLKENTAEIERNQKFVIPVRVQKIVAVPLNAGTFVTNCPTCQFTCHFPCGIPNDADKARCSAMSNGVCTVCVGHLSLE
jgi:hypothetical protein